MILLRSGTNRQVAAVCPLDKLQEHPPHISHAGYIKCAGNLQNLTLTTANTAQQAYIQASNLAYMQVTSGTMDFNTAVRHAIQTAAAAGSSVLYPSGHCDHLDVAVRRAVLTGVGQTVRQLSLINAQDMGCDLMEITAHGGARPPHAAWQGKIVSLSGRRGYLTPKSIGYGTGDGFGGWNCRHDWHPFFESVSKRAYSNARLKELNERHIEIDGEKYTDYEVSQMQRALERKIRKQKRQVAAANAAVQSAPDEAAKQAMQEDFTAQSVKLKAAEQELKDFCKQTGFLPDTSRVWVNGFGRSVSQKAVHANKKALTSGTKSGIIKTTKQKSELGKFKETLRSDARVSEEYYSEIKNRFSHGSNTAKVVFNKYVHGDSVLNAAFEGTPHYDPVTKKISMHYSADLANERGKGVTWFHEHGHLIDDAAGQISNNEEFRKLLSDDWLAYMKSYGKANGLGTFDKVQSAISKDLSSMRKHSGVSDIIQAVSHGGTQGIAGHPLGYWKDDSVICSEAFAHMFEAQFDKQRYAEMQKYFPNALKKFEEMLGGLA